MKQIDITPTDLKDSKSFSESSTQAGTKRRYAKPCLDPYGDIRSLTLAPSPGSFESGMGAGFKA